MNGRDQQRDRITFAKLSNSDLLYNNVFLQRLNKNPCKNQVYTALKKDEWLRMLRSRNIQDLPSQSRLRAARTDSSACSMCQQPFSADAWLLDSPFTAWLHALFYDENRCFCYFCLGWHCPHCMALGHETSVMADDDDQDDLSSSDQENYQAAELERTTNQNYQTRESETQTPRGRTSALSERLLPVQMQFLMNLLFQPMI